ncbi:MAG: histidine--tRNA ligase [Thaumarchaeota archaeon]|nr:histidine--tRNA ligase [Nitrososphaerota archaeon]
MEFKLPRGMRDIVPEDYRYLEMVREAFIETCRLFNFKLMEPSPLEMLSTLEAKSGEAIKDEIYFFKDKGDRDVGLRFDLTIGTARYVASKRDMQLPARIGTFGSMFRYDEPQYGRYRWFYQWNVEIFGAKSIHAEAEIIDLTSSILLRVGLRDIVIRIGDRRISESYISNVLGVSDLEIISIMLRLLDKRSKKSEEEIIREGIGKNIDPDTLRSLLNFSGVVGTLDGLLSQLKVVGYDGIDGDLPRLVHQLKAKGIDNIQIDLGLVRGLDYYTGIVFEVFDNQSKVGALAGGGRYDSLPKMFGRPELGAVGAAGGIERTIIVMQERKLESERNMSERFVYIAYAQPEFKEEVATLCTELRGGNIPATYDLADKSLRKQFEAASSMRSSLVIIIGRSEVSNHEVTIRNMATGSEVRVSRAKVRSSVFEQLKIS